MSINNGLGTNCIINLGEAPFLLKYISLEIATNCDQFDKLCLDEVNLSKQQMDLRAMRNGVAECGC